MCRWASTWELFFEFCVQAMGLGCGGVKLGLGVGYSVVVRVVVVGLIVIWKEFFRRGGVHAIALHNYFIC